MALVWPEMNPDDNPPAPVNARHANHHSFHTGLPSLFNHSFRSANMMNPEVDIRETKKEYWVDISMPGASKPENIVIKCLTAHLMTVTSKIDRPQIPSEGPTIVKGVLHQQNGDAKAEEPQDETTTHDAPHHHQQTANHSEDPPSFLLAERSVGLFNRSLHFPLEVDEDKIRAKLEHGLLSIQVPKLSRTTYKHIKVDE